MGIIVLLIYLILFCIALIYSNREKNLLNPLMIFIGILTISFSIYYSVFFLDYKIDIHNELTYYSYLLMGISYVIGFILTTSVPKKIKIKKKKSKKFIISNKTMLNIAVLAGILGIIVNLYIVREAFSYSDVFYGLRYTVVYGNVTLIGSYFILISNAYVLLTIVEGRWKQNRKTIIFLIIIWFVSCVLTLARTEFIIMGLSLFFAFQYSGTFINSKFQKISVKKIFLFSITVVIGFGIIANLLNKVNNNILYSLFEYLSYGIISFDEYISGLSNVGNGYETFKPLSQFFIEPSGYSFYIAPGEFNVYTAMRTPYMDYGLYGVGCVFFIIGCVYSYIYTKVKSGSLIYILIYSVLVSPLVFSFFDYTFNYTLWLYYFIIFKILITFRGKN